MAELKLDVADPTNELPPAKRSLLLEAVARDYASRCKVEGWTEERRVCAAGTGDLFVARTGCAEELVATPDEIEKLPPELGCDVVAKHVTVLLTGPDGKLTIIAKKHAAGKRAFDVQGAAAKLGEQQVAECEQAPWSPALRRCILASRTHHEMGNCM